MLLATGATDVSIDVMVVDDTGLAVTGLNASTFPDVYLSKGTGADIAVTPLSDLASLAAAHADGGVFERGGGVYRLDLPDTAASTAGVVKVRGEASGKHLLMEDVQVGAVSAILADGVAHGGTLGSSTATLALSRMTVASQTANQSAVTLAGNGSGQGLAVTSPTDAAVTFIGATHGLYLDTTGAGIGLHILGDISILLQGNTSDMVGNITGDLSGAVGSVTTKTGYKLASDGLDAIVPADPSAIPVLGTSSIVAWMGFLGLWSVSDVESDGDGVRLKNKAGTLLATYQTTDNGSVFHSDDAA